MFERGRLSPDRPHLVRMQGTATISTARSAPGSCAYPQLHSDGRRGYLTTDSSAGSANVDDPN